MSVGTARALWLIAILVLAGTCIALSRQLGIERDRTRLETERITNLQASLNSLQRSRSERVTVAERSSAATASSQALPAPQTASAAATAPAAARVDPNVELALRQQAMQKASAQMFDDPELRKLALSEMKTNLRAEYPDVGRQLRLTAAEEDQFVELLAEQRQRMWERASQARASGQQALALQSFEEDQRANEAEIAALLGTQRSLKFKEYQENLPDRQRVMAFMATLDDTNALETERAETLITKLAGERRSLEEKARAEHAGRPYKMSMGFANGLFLTLDDDDPVAMETSASAQMESYDKKMAEVAAPLLSTAQLEAFTTFQKRSHESLLAQVRMSMLDMQQRKKAMAAKPSQGATDQRTQ